MRIDPRRALAALALSVACGAGSPAAEPSVPGPEHLHITAVAPGYGGRDRSDTRWLVYLQGYIDTGAAARLTRLLDKERISRALVYFDSPGGHVMEAMALGRLLRQRRYATSVGARPVDGARPLAGRCYSACPIAYAGGVLRSLVPGSVLGVHRAENSTPVTDETAFQDTVTGQVRDYLASMGVNAELVTFMSAVPRDAIRVLSTDEDRRLDLVNSDDPAQGD
jgi:hypothetical protein